MTDLTAITTPFGLLDRETQEALKAHGGPYEIYGMFGLWEKRPDPAWAVDCTYRVKPAPPKPHEIWIERDRNGLFFGVYGEKPERIQGGHTCTPYREVLPE